jgi:hypothetical protein
MMPQERGAWSSCLCFLVPAVERLFRFVFMGGLTHAGRTTYRTVWIVNESLYVQIYVESVHHFTKRLPDMQRSHDVSSFGQFLFLREKVSPN